MKNKILWERDNARLPININTSKSVKTAIDGNIVVTAIENCWWARGVFEAIY